MASASRFGADGDGREDIVQLRGWEKEEVVTLLEAVGPLAAAVPDVKTYAEDALESAEVYLRNQPDGVDPHGLQLQQIACIKLYTKENLADPEHSFFKVLNRTLMDRDRKSTIKFFPYIKLFASGARLLPNACPAKLWRGFPNLAEGWDEGKFEVGKVLSWWGFSSCTRSANVLTNQSFFGTSGARTLFQIDCIMGIDISPFSDYPEAEVLLMPGAKFEVEQVMPPQMLGGVLQVVMKQLPSRHDLLLEAPELEPESEIALVPSGTGAAELAAEQEELVNEYRRTFGTDAEYARFRLQLADWDLQRAIFDADEESAFERQPAQDVSSGIASARPPSSESSSSEEVNEPNEAVEMHLTPVLMLCLLCEMVYVLQLRLDAHDVPDDKQKRILNDVVKTFTSSEFLNQLFKPGPLLEDEGLG